ncbi:MAG: prephenate dehydratase [Spirochaetes bacterium]|nr:prephenate dehydratase [Spirochaetota bacterium]
MDDRIRDIDRKILELISRRSELYIQNLKETGQPYAPGDSESLRELIEAHNRGPLSGRSLERIFTEVQSAGMIAASPVRAAFLGPEGTFSWIALREFFGTSVEPHPLKAISDVFRAVEKGEATYGVVPVENSTEGAVTFTLDELIETDLHILAERYVRISYSLLSASSDLGAITQVYSHPQPIGQCKGWLRQNLPNATVTEVSSTTRAAELAVGEPASAAIGSHEAVQFYGLNVLASMIEDSRQNYTRFFILGSQKARSTGKDKTSIVCAVKDRPGALLDLLNPLEHAGINMTKIESRPDKKKVWEYNFFIDFIGHEDDAEVAEALRGMQEVSMFIKILGSYPVGY